MAKTRSCAKPNAPMTNPTRWTISAQSVTTATGANAFSTNLKLAVKESDIDPKIACALRVSQTYVTISLSTLSHVKCLAQSQKALQSARVLNARMQAVQRLSAPSQNARMKAVMQAQTVKMMTVSPSAVAMNAMAEATARVTIATELQERRIALAMTAHFHR